MIMHSVERRHRPVRSASTIRTYLNTNRPVSFATPISAIEMPQRAINAMQAAGIETVADAAQWSLRDLQSLPQVGSAALRVLEVSLGKAGLTFQPQSNRRRRL